MQYALLCCFTLNLCISTSENYCYGLYLLIYVVGCSSMLVIGLIVRFITDNTPISRSRHFEIESEAPVGRNPEVTVNNNDLDYQPRAATAI